MVLAVGRREYVGANQLRGKRESSRVSMNRTGPGQLHFRLEEGELGGVDITLQVFTAGRKVRRGGKAK